MSSYLVALVISDFVCLKETVQDIGVEGKVDVNVCGRANAIEKLRYALIISTKTIKFLESIYGVKYPLKKAGYKITYLYCTNSIYKCLFFRPYCNSGF